MSTKVSEKKFAAGIILMISAIVIFIKTPLVTAPVYISEKGILLCLLAAALLVLAIRFFKRTILKA